MNNTPVRRRTGAIPLKPFPPPGLKRFAPALPWCVIGAACVILTTQHEAVARFGWLAGLGADEPWRWLTAHLVHLSAEHLLADGLAFAALAHLALRFDRSVPALAVLLLSALGVCLGLVMWVPSVRWYVGLSGALHGLFAWLCLAQAASANARPLRLVAAALWLGGIVKLVIEHRIPVGAPGWLGVPGVPPAHLFGYVCGTFCWAAGWAYRTVWPRRAK